MTTTFIFGFGLPFCVSADLIIILLLPSALKKATLSDFRLLLMYVI